MDKISIKITAKIDDIRYQSLIKSPIKTFDLDSFNTNDAPASCIVREKTNEIALSKWVSPKRTRSYPYARVYDTISKNKRATIIPIVKDEGADGDRDFLQWDTICLMSLLQVSVIIGYYATVSKNSNYVNKITNQKFNNERVKEHLKELLSSYHSDALHWNIRQLREVSKVIDWQIEAYSHISKITGVTFHNSSGLSNFKEIINGELDDFINYSRTRAEKAQSREIDTIHIHERLETSSKSPITITNIVGGKYFFTVDEVSIDLNSDQIVLIEGKHTNSKVLPSKADIKDGLLKMILYTNLKELDVEYLGKQERLQPKPILKLTSTYIKLDINSNSLELDAWCSLHGIKSSGKIFLQQLFEESQLNDFLVEIKNVHLI